MPVPLDFLKDPWADTGDRVQFPYNPDTITELMSWLKGFTAKYQRIPEEGGVYIERREFNQILYLLTKQVIDAFNITASDAQLDAETAARIEADEKEKAERIEADEKEKAERTEADNNLQQQLNVKFMNVEDLNVSFGVTYTADNSGIICVDLEWGNPGPFNSPGCSHINAELVCSGSSNPQFVFPCMGAWETTAKEQFGGARPNLSLVAIVEEGDTFTLRGETRLGFNAGSGIRVKSAKIMY